MFDLKDKNFDTLLCLGVLATDHFPHGEKSLHGSKLQSPRRGLDVRERLAVAVPLRPSFTIKLRLRPHKAEPSTKLRCRFYPFRTANKHAVRICGCRNGRLDDRTEWYMLREREGGYETLRCERSLEERFIRVRRKGNLDVRGRRVALYRGELEVGKVFGD